MTDRKTQAETLPLTADAFLKWEATPLTRVSIPAPKGTKTGQLVMSPWGSGIWFIALGDEKDGKVVVQPQMCAMDLQYVSDEEIAKAGGVEILITSWLGFGVGVVGTDKRYQAYLSELAARNAPVDNMSAGGA